MNLEALPSAPEKEQNKEKLWLMFNFLSFLPHLINENKKYVGISVYLNQTIYYMESKSLGVF